MPKRMKFERQAARQSRKVDPALLTPPSPDQVIQAASEGEDINRGSSDQMPLSDVGEGQAQQTADDLAKKGGLDRMIASPAVRTMQTAQPIIDKNPKPLPVRQEPALESWAQGNLEGQPQSQVQSTIRDLIRKNPRRVLPGQGAASSQPGESFDQFRLRALPAMRGIMQEFAEGISKDPGHKLGIPVHSQVIKLTNAWLKKGAPDDFSIDPKEMDKDSEAPGGVERLFPDEKGDWSIDQVDMKSPDPLEPGIYLIRHALTPQNKDNYAKADEQHSALAKMVDRVQALDFPRVKTWAQKASDAGMSDEDISSYIDSSLPSAKDAAQLPMPHVLAVAAAASPQKRAEYAPILQSHFGDLSALPPNLQKTLAAHLDAIRNS